MLKITKKIEIALIIFKHIQLKSGIKKLNFGRHAELLTVRDLAETHQISEKFLAKIMQNLCREKVLASKQGVQGGYYLIVDLNELTFLDLVEKLEGSFNVVNCISSDKNCHYHDGCTIIDPMRNLNLKFRSFYQSIKVSELIEIPFLMKEKSKKVSLSSSHVS